MLACSRCRMNGLLSFFCMCHPSFSHLYSNYLILFCSSISCQLSLSIPFSFVRQSHVHYLVPLHSNYLIFSYSINLISIISFHCIQIISFSFVHQSSVHYPWYSIPFTPFHLNYLIIRMIVPGTPIPFLSHSLTFINLMPTCSIQISFF